jgi:ribulose-5-phosphate 4-epimerase/fuculose-1-phosphate aldolase
MDITERSATSTPTDAEELVRFAREMVALGLVTGTAGNLSVRLMDGTILITPSGVDYATMVPDQLVAVGLDGEPRQAGLKPSVDTMTHLAIYRARGDVNAVIHTHSPYAAAFSALHHPIPALITESAGYLGGEVRVMDYLPPATPELGYRMADGIAMDRAVLMPNHGVMAVGETPRKAFHAAVSVEESAQVAFLAMQLGTPIPVPDSEVQRMHTFIHHRYGQR